MVAFRRHEAWDHTASIIAAMYQTSCAEEGKIFWPEAHHPGYEPIEGTEDTDSERALPTGAVPQDMVFDMMKKAMVPNGS